MLTWSHRNNAYYIDRTKQFYVYDDDDDDDKQVQNRIEVVE